MSTLKITEHRAGHVVVLKLAGKLTIGEGSVCLRETLHRLLATEQKNLLLDFAGVQFVDSAGLGELVAGLVNCQNEGGQLKLLHIADTVRELMTLTRLVTLFDIYEDELAALNDIPLGLDYKLVPYDGGVRWDDADEDERMLSWQRAG